MRIQVPRVSAKYCETVLFLLECLGGRIEGKVKLAKLMYFADFDHFEQFEAAISGDVYTNREMGPLGGLLDAATRQLHSEGAIERTQESKMAGGEKTMCLTLLGKRETSLLSESEKGTIRRVADKYGKLNGKQLTDLVHNEAPWLGTKPGEKIPYELAFYRGTAFGEC